MPLGSALAAGGWLAAVVASSDGNALLAPGFAQPALLNDQPLPLTFSPKRFLLVANNDNASSAVLAMHSNPMYLPRELADQDFAESGLGSGNALVPRIKT